MTLHEEVTFDDLGDAEWHIFKLRWKKTHRPRTWRSTDPTTVLDYKRRLLGYADRISLRPGDTVGFKISAEDLENYDFDVVRLVNGVITPTGAPYQEIAITTSADGTYPGRFQPVHAGSYAVVPKAPAFDRLSSFTLQAYVMPTLPGVGRQTIMSRGSGPKRPGFALLLDENGALALMVGNGDELVTISTGVAILRWQWAFVAATYDAGNRAISCCGRNRTRASPRSTLMP